MSQAGTTAEAMDAGTTAGEIENGAELVIDVAGIVETPASLDESTTATEAAAVEEIPFDPSANTDAGIEPRTQEATTVDTATDATTEQAEPGNDLAEEGATKDPDAPDFGVAISDDGEVLQSGMDVRAHREYERRRNAAQSRVADAYLSMVSAKVEAKAAADHLTSEGEALEKIVAGGWRAIKREMEAGGRAASVFSSPVSVGNHGDGEIVDGSFTVVDKPDSIYGDSATLDAQAPSEAVSDAWRDCTIAELGAHGLRASLVKRLSELGYDTIGKLEDLREKISTGAVDRWPKGIGEAKITEIENAVVGWLTANRDAGVFGAIPTSVGDEVETSDAEDAAEGGQDSASDSSDPRYPTMESWDKMTADQKKDWFGSRCENLGDLKARESEKAFDAGRDAWHAGKNVDACEYYPGARGDDWLRGWVTGSMEPQRVKAAAVKPDDQPAKESTSVDDLFG